MGGSTWQEAEERERQESRRSVAHLY